MQAEKLLNTTQAAELLGLSTATLTTWRSRGRYPLKFVRAGRAIRYRLADVLAFIEARTEPGDGPTSGS